MKRSCKADFPYKFDLEKALHELSFFPKLKHYKGKRWKGKPFDLADWQLFSAGNIYGWVEKKTGLRRFDRAYIEVSKKSGKSFLAAAMAMKQTFFDREPGAESYSIATMREQAWRLWNDAREMVEANPQLKKRIRTMRGVSVLVNEATASRFQPLGRDSNSADGVNPYCVIADELHRHRDDELINVMADSMAARDEPLMIEITTAGAGRDNIGWTHHKYACEILEGIQENESRFVFIAGADEEDKDNWQDPKIWKKANPSWNLSVNPKQVEKASVEAAAMPTKLNDFLRYHLNIWVESYVRWLSMDLWDGCPAIERELSKQLAFMGLDLAKTRDLAALVLVLPDEDGHFDALPWFWMPKEGLMEKVKEDKVRYDIWANDGHITLIDGPVIDQDVIKAKILELRSIYQIEQIGYDPWQAQKLVGELEKEIQDPDVLVEIPQNFRHLSEPTQFLEDLIKKKKLCHNNHPVLRWMAGNASVKTNEDGHIKIDKKHSANQKIDGIVALIMALGRAVYWAEQEKEKPSVYETRGPLVFNI